MLHTSDIIPILFFKLTGNGNLIFHSDCGGKYLSKAFRECLGELDVKQSFSQAHVPFDNSVAETFFSSMKREELYRAKYRPEKEFKKAVDNYILFFKTQRPHAKCNTRLRHKRSGICRCKHCFRQK